MQYVKNSLIYQLQWGRNFFVTEIAKVDLTQIDDAKASMGP